MPSLANHKSNSFVKLLLLGNSGTGKTGALTSLAKAGYKIRVLDYDNGLDILSILLKKEAPDKLNNVEFITLRDKIKAGPTGPMMDGMPKAFMQGMKMLNSWDPISIGKEGDNLGAPSDWGPDCILVIDSLTFLSRAAFNQAVALNPTSASGKSADGRQWYGEAQKGVLQVLGLLTDETFNTNVIVIAHIDYQDMPDGTNKGFPNSVGKAIGPQIPSFFNSVAFAEATGSPPKRTIKTVSTLMVDLKSPAAFKMAPVMPVETALADYFRITKE